VIVVSVWTDALPFLQVQYPECIQPSHSNKSLHTHKNTPKAFHMNHYLTSILSLQAPTIVSKVNDKAKFNPDTHKYRE
jgi:hypothetical protein